MVDIGNNSKHQECLAVNSFNKSQNKTKTKTQIRIQYINKQTNK